MENKVVIITGASSGIGKALAFEYAQGKYKVVIAARNIDALNVIKNDLEKNGAEVLAVKTDVSIEDDCKNLIDKTVERFNGIDILINNAGVSMRANFVDLKLEVLKKLMDINFWGTVYCTKHALPYLLERKGSVAGVSSISGFTPLPGRTGYCASKFAMHGFLESLRLENMKTGLHVLVAAPGFTQSNVRLSAFTANGKQQGETPRDESKMLTAEYVAKQIFKAIKKRKRTRIISPKGKIIVIFNKLYPKLLDRIVYKQMSKEPDAPFK
ncbi:MAG: SDR family oxidoreductase [Saprospiraceae bacterium]|nr:SDR family oxidoreductase [Saprospiraceae bacterium]